MIHVGKLTLPKKGGGRWHVVLYDDVTGETSIRSLRTANLSVAQAKQRALRAEMLGQAYDETRQPLDDALRDWLEWYAHSDRAERSLNNARTLARRLRDAFEAALLSDLTLERLERWQATMLEEEKLAPTTVGLHTKLCRSFLAWCVTTDRLRRNPAALLRAPRATPRVNGRDVPDSALWAILGSLEEREEPWALRVELRAFFEVLAWSGLRWSTALQLCWADCPIGKDPRWVIPAAKMKTRQPLVVPMHPEARDALTRVWTLRTRHGQASLDRIWTQHELWYRRHWNATTAELCLPYRPHDLRGRYENWLRRPKAEGGAGVTPEVYLHLMGRRSATEMIRRYISISSKEAFEKLYPQEPPALPARARNIP